MSAGAYIALTALASGLFTGLGCYLFVRIYFREEARKILRQIRDATPVVYVVARLPDSRIEEYAANDSWIRDCRQATMFRNPTAAQVRAEQAVGAYVLAARLDRRGDDS